MATETARLRPLGNRVVVKPNEREERTASGIVLPDTIKEKPQKGAVLAAGPGRRLDDGKLEPMDVAVGQTVLFARYAGSEFRLDGQDVLIIKAEDILAVIEA